MPVIPSFSFNTSFDSYTRTLACGSDGRKIPLNCPLDSTTYHLCDWDAYGNGSSYFATYLCPMVVPSCLTWNSEINEFTDENECQVVDQYSPGIVIVICSCTSLESMT